MQVGATTVVNRRFGDALVRSFSVSEGPTVWQFGNANAHTTSGWTHPYPATFDVVNTGPRPAALRLVVGSAKDWTTWYTAVQACGARVPARDGRE